MRRTGLAVLPLLVLTAACDPLVKEAEQAKEWKPPQTTITSEFVAATQFLLAHGMADPRGGEYRKATILVSSAWRAEPVKGAVHGWVLPNSTVVAWDGLAYTTESVGEAVDLAKDLEANPLSSPIPGSVFGTTFTPFRSPLGPSLLLILGETKLAELSYRAPEKQTSGETFARLANAYLVRRFHRAVEAHMAGNDGLAYEDAKELERTGSQFEEEAVRLYGRESVARRFQAGPETGEVPRVFSFLSPVESLRTDSKRRLDRPKGSVDLKALESLPQHKRIESLIEALDEVKARQWGQPGGVNILDDPIAAALAKEGDTAVDPLLVVIETDQRLTRSVSFGRDFVAGRNLISVSSAAYAIVSTILQLSLTSREMYKSYSAEELRAFWRENKGRTRAERLLGLLADDRGNRRQWLEAASQVVQSVDIRHEGSWVLRKRGEPSSRIVGEELREESNPSVAVLMAKRAIQTAGNGPMRSSDDQFACADALRMGIALAKWDLTAALPTLVQLSKRAIAMTDPTGHRSNAAESIYPVAASVLEWRVRGGDRSAWDDYATLLRDLEPQGSMSPEVFSPLWKFPDDFHSRRLAEATFLGPDSKFMRAVRKRGPLDFALTRLVESPVLKVRSFRDLLVVLLDDKTEIGLVVRDSSGIRYTMADNKGGGGRGLNLPKGDATKVGDSATFRICDQIALELAQLKGAPFYNPVWEEAKRNAALRKLQVFVKSIAKIEDVLPEHVLSRYGG